MNLSSEKKNKTRCDTKFLGKRESLVKNIDHLTEDHVHRFHSSMTFVIERVLIFVLNFMGSQVVNGPYFKGKKKITRL